MKVFLGLALGLICAVSARAATINCASCSNADVQTAINSAVDGDIVVVPAGTCTWTAQVTCTKGITLEGQGTNSSIISGSIAVNGGMLNFSDTGKTKSFHVTGFSFENNAAGNPSRALVIFGWAAWRVSNCKFVDIQDRGMLIEQSKSGLVDTSWFGMANGVSGQGIAVIGNGTNSWNEASALGTTNMIYFEEIVADFGGVNDSFVDAYDGGSYVIRHSKLYGVDIGHHGLDSGTYRSCKEFEVYSNFITNTTSEAPSSRFMHARGGTGIVCSNKMDLGYNSFITFDNYRSCIIEGFHTVAAGWGACDGSNSIDGNTPGENGYPCREQIGRTTGQALLPVYCWQNTMNGVNAAANINFHAHSGCFGGTEWHLQDGRDFYSDTQSPSWEPLEFPHTLRGEEPAPSSDILRASLTGTQTYSGRVDFK